MYASIPRFTKTYLEKRYQIWKSLQSEYDEIKKEISKKIKKKPSKINNKDIETYNFSFWNKFSRFRMKQKPIVLDNSLICPPSFHGSFRCLIAVVELILKTIDKSIFRVFICSC